MIEHFFGAFRRQKRPRKIGVILFWAIQIQSLPLGLILTESFCSQAPTMELYEFGMWTQKSRYKFLKAQKISNGQLGILKAMLCLQAQRMVQFGFG